MSIEGPRRLDVEIGRRIRERRRLIGMSQVQLARAVGVTFQQVQKYERGANRVSASRLWEIAGALQVGIGYFYEGLPEPGDTGGMAPVRRDVEDLLLINDGPELAASFLRIRDPRLRRKLVELIRAMTEDDEPAERP